MSDVAKRQELVDAVMRRMPIAQRIAATPQQIYSTLRVTCDHRGASVWFASMIYQDWIRLIKDRVESVWCAAGAE